ncbi:hypothetical protein DV736_g5598, partial [Chaetothyriales sp. CBS 134916]
MVNRQRENCHINLDTVKANSRRIIFQSKSPGPQIDLYNALTGFVPPAIINYGHCDIEKSASLIIPGFHFVYCNEMMPPSHLLPDGTDDLHCPSPHGDFMFRLWAGGDISFARHGHRHGHTKKKPSLMTSGNLPTTAASRSSSTLCLGEQVVDAKMVDGGDKVFVKVRRILVECPFSSTNDDDTITDNNDNNNSEAETKLPMCPSNDGLDNSKVDFHWLVTPDAALLFRFSALTLNAHAIHLDREYTRRVYGLPDLVVHGPLTVCLMMQVLLCAQRRYESARGLSSGQLVIDSLSYTNIAPLYVDQTMKICVKEPPSPPPAAEEKEEATAGQVWAVWISKKVNGMWKVAVRANAKVSGLLRE